MTAWPPIAVFGAGAVGSYFGGMLARAGAPVTFVGRAAHVEAIRERGLTIDARDFQASVSAEASMDPAAVAGARILLLCVKSTDTESAGRSVASHLDPACVVVSLQNGVDNAERLRPILPNRVVPSVVYVSAEMTGPGRVRHNGRGDLIIGSPRGVSLPGLDALAATFVRAGIPCRVSQDFERDLWEKLALNGAFNPVSALGQARYARLASHEPALRLLIAVIDEVVAVARAEGIALSSAGLADAARALAAAVPAAISSTAQDLAAGRPTEIDHLNGYVVARGVARGVPTPVNRTLHALVRLLQERDEG